MSFLSFAPHLRREGPLIRVGHKGADGIITGNTTKSFDVALGTGVEMIEFDVLSERTDGSGELLVAHDYEHLTARGTMTIAQALAYLSQSRFAEMRFDVDMKLPGYELRTLAALSEAGLLERSLISSMYLRSLDVIRQAAPSVPIGWSVPRVRRDYTMGALTRYPALAVVTGLRLALPYAATRALRSGRCDAIMAQWRLVTRELVRKVKEAGGELYVWTVDDAARIARLDDLGVTGVITNDPRLFAAYAGAV